MDEETMYYLAFSVFPGIGPVRFTLLRDYFQSAKAAYTANAGDLRSVHLSERLLDQFIDFRKKFHPAAYAEQLEKMHIHVLTSRDSKYPKRLLTISDPPFVLYVKGLRGVSPIQTDRAIGVVGTRKMTPYGEEVTRTIVNGLVVSGCTIVSGMAYGVDAVAHASALDAGGQTIAVLGCGVDIIAPPSNTSLYHRICESGMGAVISEMPLGLRPNKGLFPARNRIISGLSLGVVVTEGADDSGSLITARNAGEQGREVFAVPGPITSPYSHGPAKLLKSGAKLVEGAEDILEELNISQTHVFHTSKSENLTDTEKIIYSILNLSRMHIDDLVRRTGLTISETAATLTVLEMKGVVQHTKDDMYCLAV